MGVARSAMNYGGKTGDRLRSASASGKITARINEITSKASRQRASGARGGAQMA